MSKNPSDTLQRAIPIVYSALDVPEEERAAFIAEACKNDIKLKKTVEKIIEQAINEDSSDTNWSPFLGKNESIEIAPIIEIASVIENRYEIQEDLGQGGMGHVYRAEDKRLNRSVALKFLTNRHFTSATQLQRFQIEARSLAQFVHTNICVIYDVIQDGQCIVMEYVDGLNLEGLIADEPLTVAQVIDIGIQVSNGLEAAHDKEIIHRDLKPSNIMLTKGGLIKILDFGIAFVNGGSRITGIDDYVGTAYYMAPEQITKGDIDARTDLWSLGVVLYELLTKNMPFTGPIASLLHSVVYDEPTPITDFREDIPPDLALCIHNLIEKNPADRFSSAVTLRETLGNIKEVHIGASGSSKRIFISYKNDAKTDAQLANELYDALKDEHHVFIDTMMDVGVSWVKYIYSQISEADFVVVFLSEDSIQSEMLLLEIELAHKFFKANGVKPRILPIRVNYYTPFQYPLNVYLNHINWALWRDEEDTAPLIQKIRNALHGTPLPFNTNQHDFALLTTPSENIPIPQPFSQPLELPDGTMSPDSTFYIERPADRAVIESILLQGVTITIKGPRQMGKSSLLRRIMDTAQHNGKRVAFLDFQLFERSAMERADDFFYQFSTWLTDLLELDDQVDAFWKPRLGNVQRCDRYMQRYILKTLNEPLVLAMDEVETVFDTDFRSDFFGMLRAWHNNRLPGSVWQNLDIVLVTSTEPYQFIENLSQSPFNVGEVVELDDFLLPQVTELNRRHNRILSEEDLERLYAEINGHPFLTRRALYFLASGRIKPDELFETASDDRGLFGDHLRNLLFRLEKFEDLKTGFYSVIQHHSCPDNTVFFKLRGAGLIRRKGDEVVPSLQTLR